MTHEEVVADLERILNDPASNLEKHRKTLQLLLRVHRLDRVLLATKDELIKALETHIAILERLVPGLESLH